MAVNRVFNSRSFVQQVRVMLRRLSRSQGGQKESEYMNQLLEEKLYFVSPLSLDAPTGEIGEVSELNDGHCCQVEVYSWGLTGAEGAMPVAYTEWLIERYYRYGDRSAKYFFDIFNHRLHILRFLAWRKYRFYANQEFYGFSTLTTPLRSLSGVLHSSARLQHLEYAGLFAQPVRSLVCLEQWLQHRFSIPVQIKPFTGRWSALHTGECCQLGRVHQTLAQSPAIGSVFWDLQTCFIIELGPLTHKTARSFLNQSDEYQSFIRHVRDFVGVGLVFSLELLIQNTNEVTRLGSGELGFDICLGSQMGSQVRRIRLPVNVD